jgi:DNA invertase Pin-like site-specific DNA recombinase
VVVCGPLVRLCWVDYLSGKVAVMTKAFAYLRVSGKGQIDGDGFDRQLLAVQQYAAANEIEIVEVFREEGISGTKELDDRPALSELFAALEENGIKTVLIEKMDRLARDLMIQEAMVSDMQKHGYTLLSTCEPDLCSTDPSRVLIRQIFGALAQYDRAMIVLKLRGARQRKKAKTGKGEGRDSFGVKPGEALTLEQMKEWRTTGATFQHIADDLNNCGYKSRTGKPWKASVVAKILAREERKVA